MVTGGLPSRSLNSRPTDAASWLPTSVQILRFSLSPSFTLVSFFFFVWFFESLFSWALLLPRTVPSTAGETRKGRSLLQPNRLCFFVLSCLTPRSFRKCTTGWSLLLGKERLASRRFDLVSDGHRQLGVVGVLCFKPVATRRSARLVSKSGTGEQSWGYWVNGCVEIKETNEEKRNTWSMTRWCDVTCHVACDASCFVSLRRVLTNPVDLTKYF